MSFLGYLVEWRTSFRIYKGVVVAISSGTVTVWEINEEEIHILPNPGTRLTKIRPYLTEYILYVLKSHLNIDKNTKISLVEEALNHLDTSDRAIQISKERYWDDFIESMKSDSESEEETESDVEDKSIDQTSSIKEPDSSLEYSTSCSITMFPCSSVETIPSSKELLVGSKLPSIFQNNLMRISDSDNMENRYKCENKDSENDEGDDGEDEDDNEDDTDESDSSSNSSDEELINIKVMISAKSVTRGFSVGIRNGIMKIKKQIAKDNSVKKKEIRLFYIDDDGDRVDIMARSDLEYAIKVHSAGVSGKKPLKISCEWDIASKNSMTPSSKQQTVVTPRKSDIEVYDERAVKLPPLKDGKNVESPIVTSGKLVWKKGEIVGVGSFGHVYSGLDLTSGEKIAVKEIVLKRSLKFEKHALSISNEVKLLSLLEHRNIVRYFGSEFINDTIRIFLELATDGSIKDMLLEFGPLAESLVSRFTVDILNGLEFLHSKRIIHRDIKPSNLLVFNGLIKLADFGCSSIGNFDDMGSTKAGHLTIAGTGIYMSPEILLTTEDKLSNVDVRNSPQPQTAGYGRKTDIWSLGITLVEMSLGKAPFRNVASAVYAVCVNKVYPTFPETFSISAQDFLSHCLVENPKDRFSAAELIQHRFLFKDIDAPHSLEDLDVNSSNIQRLPDDISSWKQWGNGEFPPTSESEKRPKHSSSKEQRSSEFSYSDYLGKSGALGNNKKENANSILLSSGVEGLDISFQNRTKVSNIMDQSSSQPKNRLWESMDGYGSHRRSFKEVEKEDVTYSNLSDLLDFRKTPRSTLKDKEESMRLSSIAGVTSSSSYLSSSSSNISGTMNSQEDTFVRVPWSNSTSLNNS